MSDNDRRALSVMRTKLHETLDITVKLALLANTYVYFYSFLYNRDIKDFWGNQASYRCLIIDFFVHA